MCPCDQGQVVGLCEPHLFASKIDKPTDLLMIKVTKNKLCPHINLVWYFKNANASGRIRKPPCRAPCTKRANWKGILPRQWWGFSPQSPCIPATEDRLALLHIIFLFCLSSLVHGVTALRLLPVVSIWFSSHGSTYTAMACACSQLNSCLKEHPFYSTA